MNTMMDILLKLTEQDMLSEIKKPKALRLYPRLGTSDPDDIEFFGLPLTT